VNIFVFQFATFSLQTETGPDAGLYGNKTRLRSILISANQIHEFGSSQWLPKELKKNNS